MKLSLSILATLAAVPATMANFDLYVDRTVNTGATANGWALFPGEPNCDQANSAHIYSDKDDVSGNKRGVRCKGSGCQPGNDPSDIELIEFNFASDAHWTIYKDRNYDMIGKDGQKYGSCHPYPGDDYRCEIPPLGRGIGERKFQCLTSKWDA